MAASGVVSNRNHSNAAFYAPPGAVDSTMKAPTNDRNISVIQENSPMRAKEENSNLKTLHLA